MTTTEPTMSVLVWSGNFNYPILTKILFSRADDCGIGQENIQNALYLIFARVVFSSYIESYEFYRSN